MAVGDRKKVWDNYKVVGEATKGPKNKFVVGLGTRDGVKYINIREFYKCKRDNHWKPSLSGIAIPIEFPIVTGDDVKILKPANGIAILIKMAKELAVDFELADPEHEVWYITKTAKH
jgi:hypothetical protein